MNVAALEKESPEAIRDIWTTYHEEKDDYVSSVMEYVEYRSLAQNAAASPLFLYPVRREGGFFVMLSQMSTDQRQVRLPAARRFTTPGPGPDPDPSLDPPRSPPATCPPHWQRGPCVSYRGHWVSFHLFNGLL